MGRSRIEWTQFSWNPVWGCTKVSPGCDHCYAERLTRFQGKDFSKVRLLPHKLDYPKTIKKPSMFFVNAFSDLFHEEVPDSYRDQIYKVMMECPQHTFQILTKRPVQMRRYLSEDRVALHEGIWHGVSVETSSYLWRLRELKRIAVDLLIPSLFVSFEPLLARIDTDLLAKMPTSFLSWVITGGESDYTHPRPMDPQWARDLRDYFQIYHIPFFHKQNGGSKKCKCHNSYGCCLLDGKEYREFPERMVPED